MAAETLAETVGILAETAGILAETAETLVETAGPKSADGPAMTMDGRAMITPVLVLQTTQPAVPTTGRGTDRLKRKSTD
jgi:hypothetical protein